MRVLCVGAGPAGLYSALLLKRGRPDWEVVVHEQNAPDETFGFGVVFSEPTLKGLADRDPATYEALLAISQRWDPIELRLRGEALRCHGQGFVGVGRHAFLSMLRDRAAAAGVELRYRSALDVAHLPPADVVIAADGSRSALRRLHAESFDPSIETASSRFIWFGTTKRFDCLTFLFAANDHGVFGVHAYPYSEERGTFIVETDAETLAKAGLVSDDPVETERATLAYCERLFASDLQGHGLLANQSRWGTFRTIRNASWHAGNIVLVGDSAHTAHFSMGSGTKMALEDGLALADALGNASDLDTPTGIERALASFEAARRADVRKLQQAARPSLAWWESFRHHLDRDVEQVMFHFLTRNMRVTRDSIRRRDPALVDRVEEWFRRKYGGHGAASPLDVPFTAGRVRLANRRISETTDDDSAALVLVDAADAGAADRATRPGGAVGLRCSLEIAVDSRATSAWLDVDTPVSARSLEALSRLRELHGGVLAVRVMPGKHEDDAVVRFAVDAARLGADVIVLPWTEKGLPDVVACAEAVRMQAPVPIAMAAEAAGVDPATLVLSGRADLCLVSGAAAA